MVLLLVLFIVGLYLWISKKQVVLGKAFVSICAFVTLIPGVLIAMFLIAISNVHADVINALLAIFALLALVTFVFVLLGLLKKRCFWIPTLCGWLVFLVVVGCSAGYVIHDDSIPTIGEFKEQSGHIQFVEYTPYRKDTKAVSLDEPSTLTISEDLPRMDGATALYPVYTSFAKAVYPMETKIEQSRVSDALDCSTTTFAYRNIVTGKADIIFVAGPSAEQEQFAKDNGVELVYTPIGREAFVFFVNSQNPLDDITLAQVQGIYSGEITEWSALGVPGLGKIRAFQRDAGSGSQTALERLMAGKELMEAPQADVIGDMGLIVEKAADYKNYKNAIGYSFRFYSTEMVQNEQIKLLKLNGVAPTLENIENGTYPVASYFYAVTRSDASENTKLLLDWILSEQGQAIIEKVGYTPLH